MEQDYKTYKKKKVDGDPAFAEKYWNSKKKLIVRKSP